MEDILASIKKVIAEEKEQRQALTPSIAANEEAPSSGDEDEDEDVLELDQPVAAEPSGPPLLDDSAAHQSRSALEQLSTVAASAPAVAAANPLEEVVREMLRPVLKQWLDENLPRIVEEHVRREISRITGKPL